jgi:quercetin dioxygenase-like cupin family protein
VPESERTRERERPPLKDNPYERVLAARRELYERNATGPVVIPSESREVHLTRQGRLHYFLDPVSFKETPLQHWRVFTHQIRTRSGKHIHQGGLVIYVIEGKGYSVVDGVRVDWEKGDLVLLPLTIGGVEHQHFNLDPDKPSTWAAFINVPISEHLASDLEQTEVSPEFSASQ